MRILKIAENVPDYYTQKVAKSPYTSPEILGKILDRGHDNFISCLAAENLNCPPEALTAVLSRGNNDYVSQNAAQNPNCPPEALAEVLSRGEGDMVSQYAAKNPNCPPEARIEVLSRGNDDLVSQYAAENLNTPPEAKIKWMRDTGKIGKENPSKHIIDEVVEEKDEDLEALENLVSSNVFNLKRYAEGYPDYYNGAIASNPNVSPDILAKILRLGNDDYISRIAAENHNAPPEALAEVLGRGNNNMVSWNAVRNLNCPPEALANVLSRGNEDDVSWGAAQNPNCPPEAKIKWMINNGKIGKEDPSKHIIDEVVEEKDEDLEALENLVSNRVFNLKRYAEGHPDYAEELPDSPEALEGALFRGLDERMSWRAARHPNTPPEALARYVKATGYDDDNETNWQIAMNPSTPAEILEEMINRGLGTDMSFHAVSNPNVKVETLINLLSKGMNDDVSLEATKNEKCPPEVKIQWMRDTGRIGKEDSSKHIIEYDSKGEEVDEDLLALENLVSNRVFNLKRYAEGYPDYYTREIAKNPNTSPEILAAILSRGDDDYVSNYATMNPNTPPEVLAEVLSRGSNNYVSINAADNPNCPPEALAEVLSRGKSDSISEYAARNPNCPPEALAEVLSRGKNDSVSQYVADNPNCPPEVLVEILSRGNDDDVSGCVALNPSTPPEALAEVLSRGNDDGVSEYAARNPNCPPEALAEVLSREKNNGLEYIAADNPNCPPEALAEVLSRGKSDSISECAAQKPNCPPEAKIQWMRSTGKIGKEDPSKHIIDEVVEEKDEDLEALENLISKNNNWYKVSQNIYRGDPESVGLYDYDPEYGVHQLGKDFGSSRSEGPGIYFTTKENEAKGYGGNVTSFNIDGANILTQEYPMFSEQKIEDMIDLLDDEAIELAASNWDEDFHIGKQKLIGSIMNADNAIDQIMTIWSDIFYQQDAGKFMRLMASGGIDGIAIERNESTHYAIYNRDALRAN